MKCKNCWHYKIKSPFHGLCAHEQLVDGFEASFFITENAPRLTTEALYVAHNKNSHIEVGEDFGCIHFVQKSDHSAKEEKILLQGANGEVISGEIEPGANVGRGGRAPSEEENTRTQTGQAVFNGKLSAYSFILDKVFWDNPSIRLSDSQNCTAAVRNGVLHIQQLEKRPETIDWAVIVYADKADQPAKEEKCTTQQNTKKK